jgi:hypothetical protein
VGGWAISLIAPALIGIAAAVYFASASRRRHRRIANTEKNSRGAGKKRENAGEENSTVIDAAYIAVSLPAFAQ